MIADCGKVNILGIDVLKMSMADVIERCDRHIQDRAPVLLGVVNVAKVIRCRKDAELRDSIREADIVVADGQPLVWLSRLMGDPLPERVAGIDIMHRLLELADRKNYAVYFLGATQEVVQKVVEYVRARYPGVRIAGHRDGFFSCEQDSEVAADICRSRADILFVAITSPKKENFLRRYGEMMQVPVCHGVGGSFDVVAGVTKRAPRWMQSLGLEWFYRVLQEPRRMWRRYLVTNTLFTVLAAREALQARLRRRRGRHIFPGRGNTNKTGEPEKKSAAVRCACEPRAEQGNS
jgi:N-acetylglucosaminyldiphosphoundecaprenol N-acetyl-beta-D-mannosaminyltransferase